jgi:hypothetical protein
MDRYSFEDAQHQADLETLKQTAKEFILWEKEMLLKLKAFNYKKGQFLNPQDKPDYFNIPAFIREEAEKELNQKFI